MREEVKALIESRASWRLHQDPVLRDLREARLIALKQDDQTTVAVLDTMIAEQTALVLSK